MTRDFAAAYQIARPLALNGDRAGATALLCSLLWSVHRDQGGFDGLSDEELREYCDRDPRLSYIAATVAMWAPEPWPTAEVIVFPVGEVGRATARDGVTA